MTFSTLYTTWLAEKNSTAKATSLSTYSILAEKHILPVLGEKEEIGLEDVSAMMDSIQGKGLSRKTALLCSNVVKSVLKYAARKGWCAMPDWTVSTRNASQARREAVLSEKEHRKLLAYLVADRTPRNIGLFLAATTGITRSELCHLRWQDIDFDNRLLHVVDPDNGSILRSIPLTDVQLDFLLPERGMHRPDIYVNSNGDTPSTADALRWYSGVVFNELGLGEHQFKDLRESFAIRCLESGCDLVGLAALLGRIDYTNLVKAYGKYLRRNPRQDMERMMKGLTVNGTIVTKRKKPLVD